MNQPHAVYDNIGHVSMAYHEVDLINYGSGRVKRPATFLARTQPDLIIGPIFLLEPNLKYGLIGSDQTRFFVYIILVFNLYLAHFLCRVPNLSPSLAHTLIRLDFFRTGWIGFRVA